MVLSVPQDRLAELLELSAAEDVESTVIGTFGTNDRQLVLHYRGREVGRLSMDFLHHGIPMPRRKAVVGQRDAGDVAVSSKPLDQGRGARATDDVRDRLLALLAHPNIASKHWVIRQYDHEVQGGSVVKPLTGPRQVGPSDAAVIRPKLGSYRGVALAVGMAPQVADPYDMALASIDEAVRNAVAVGADPGKLAILDNFCWPSVDDEKSMGTLVAACEACRDAALAYGIPFISGKDSLHNQFTNSETGEVIRIPNTLLISAIGVVEDVRRCVTMDLKRAGNVLYRVEAAELSLDGLAAAHRAVAAAVCRGNIAACHDVSDGGWLVAAAEMCIASGLGLLLEPDDRSFFDEPRGQYLVEFEGEEQELAALAAKSPALRFHRLGPVQHSPELVLHLDEEGVQVPVEQLTRAWRGTLDW
jgi:phosphoribosylformylglycinamidine synthase